VTEKELALTFDATHCKWRVLGNTKDMAATRERQEILETLISVKRPLKSSDIAVYVGKSNEAVRRLLYRMVDDGTLIRKGKEYTPSNVTLMENKPFI
jgi:CRP-like cAMP-binding protein